MTDKEIIKGQANIDISNLRKAQEQGIITEFGKGKLEALEGIVDFINYLQEEPISEEQVKKSTETQHVNETCKEKVNSLTQVHASEDLDDAAIEICSKVLKGETINIDGYEYVVLSDAEECFKAGANYQTELFEKNRLAACDKQTEGEAKIEFDFAMGIIKKEHRQPTFDDAIKYGMRLQEERMMAKAIDAHCFGFQGDALFSFTLPADNYLVGSEVKVIVIEK